MSGAPFCSNLDGFREMDVYMTLRVRAGWGLRLRGRYPLATPFL